MAKKMYKKERVTERLHNDLNVFLRTHVKDSRLTHISFTKVDLTSDLSIARVYWDTFDSSLKEEASSALEHIKGRLRSLLAKTLQIRHTPALSFIYDSQFESEQNIASILEDERKKGKFTGTDSQ